MNATVAKETALEVAKTFQDLSVAFAVVVLDQLCTDEAAKM